MTAEQYLATHFEREPEFVRGKLVERGLPNLSRSKVRQRLAVLLDGLGYGCLSVSLKLAGDLFRTPDFATFEQRPEKELPESPPLLIVEIASPDDRLRDVEQKLEEYRTWGVAHVWFVEPEMKKLYTYDRGLTNVARLELPQFNLTITAEDLFA